MDLPLPFQSEGQLPLRVGSTHAQFLITSQLSFPYVLEVFVQWLKIEFSILPKSNKRNLFDHTEPAVLSILRSTIPSSNGCCQNVKGFIHSKVPLTQKYPKKMFNDDLSVEFSNSGVINYDIVQLDSEYMIFQIGPNISVPIEKVFTPRMENLQQEQAQPVQLEEEEEKVIEIKKSKSSSPCEPELELEDEDQGLASTNAQTSMINSERFVFDVEEIFANKNCKELKLSDMTSSMRELFYELSTSGKTVSLSAKSTHILIQKMQNIDDKIAEDIGVIKEENIKLKDEITELRHENKKLQDKYEESSEKHQRDIEDMKAEIQRMKAEMETSRQKKTKKIKMEMDMSSSQILKNKPLKEDQRTGDDLSSSFMSLFPEDKVEVRSGNSLFRKIQQGAKEKMEEEKDEPVDPIWKKKIDYSVLMIGDPPSQIMTDSKKDRRQSQIQGIQGLEEEIFDSFLLDCQNLWGQTQEINIFSTQKSADIFGRGSSSLVFSCEFIKSKFIVAPVFKEQKHGKRFGLLILSNEKSWLQPPFSITSYYLDTKQNNEPPDCTSKLMKYLLDSIKTSKEFSSVSIDFPTEIEAKPVNVAKELRSEDSFIWILYYLNLFITSSDKKKFLTTKHNPKSEDLKVFRESLYKRLLSFKK